MQQIADNHDLDLVLLDLNMPLMDGHATLNVLRKQDEFRDIPVVIFSTSTAPTDIQKSYMGGANTYIAKPQSFDALCVTMQKLSEYWFDTAERANVAD
jgi:CheY-like chemotaxis protein